MASNFTEAKPHLVDVVELEALKDGTIANNFVRKSESQMKLFNEKPRKHWNLHLPKRIWSALALI